MNPPALWAYGTTSASRRFHLLAEVVSEAPRSYAGPLLTACGVRMSLTTSALSDTEPENLHLCDDCALADVPMAVVYRCRGTDDLLYVGKTTDLAKRLATHARCTRLSHRWWSDVEHIQTTVYEDDDAATAAERLAITTEGPIFNTRNRPPAINNGLNPNASDLGSRLVGSAA